MSLTRLNIPSEPLSPRQTFGGESLETYYAPILPEGVCSEDSAAVCPLGRGRLKNKLDGDGDDGDDGDNGDDDLRIVDEVEESEFKHLGDAEDYTELDVDEVDENGGGGGQPRQNNNDEDDFNGDDREIKVDTGPEPVRYYVMPQNPVRFGNNDVFPYKWMAPDYVDMFTVNGAWYPSVAHYVISKLATPIQLKSVNSRLWIQKNQKYDYTKPLEVKKKGLKYFDVLPDTLKSPKDFYTYQECLEILPERIEKIYQQLFIRFTDRALNIKLRDYPFRQILFTTGDNEITYYDDPKNKTATAARSSPDCLQKYEGAFVILLTLHLYKDLRMNLKKIRVYFNT
jgi:hypothetical protein